MDPPADLDAARPHAIAVGAIYATRIFQVDAITPPPAKLLPSRMTFVIDGMALSAACAFARLGGRAGIWSRVGDDAQGHAARAALDAEGIDTRGLRAVPGATTSQSAVIVDARGERLVVPFQDPTLDRDATGLPLAQLDTARMLLVDPRWAEGATAAMRAARARHVPCMLDGDVAPRAVMDALLPLATHAVFSDAGLLAYTGLHEVEAALAHVATRVLPHAAHVGATCGADGYAWFEGGTVRRVPSPRVTVVDTLAAGDVFHGAFALALVEGRAVGDAARFACHAAALKCARVGGRLGCPTRAEVDASLR